MKYLCTALLGMLFTLNLHAEQITYNDGLKYKYYNSVWKRQSDKPIFLKIDTENNDLYMYIDETLGISAIQMDRNHLDALIGAIEKYNKWNKQASSKGVTLEKEITKITPKGYFNKSGDTWHFGSGKSFSVQFFSQNKNIHQLVFMFPNVTSNVNDFIKHKINTVYLTYKQANDLKKALSKDTISKFLLNNNKQKAIADEFK